MDNNKIAAIMEKVDKNEITDEVAVAELVKLGMNKLLASEGVHRVRNKLKPGDGGVF